MTSSIFIIILPSLLKETPRLKKYVLKRITLMHTLKILLWFLNKGYPLNLVKEKVQRVLRHTPSDENNSKKVTSLPLLVTYNLAFKNWPRVTRKKLQLFFTDEQVKKVFSPATSISCRSTGNLNSYLARSKIYPLKKKVDSKKCNSKRFLLGLNVTETDIFQWIQTKEQFKINNQLNHNDKCLICYFPVKCVVCIT